MKKQAHQQKTLKALQQEPLKALRFTNPAPQGTEWLGYYFFIDC